MSKETGVEMAAAASGSSGHEEALDASDNVYKSTHADAQNMSRMGRRQELVRHYRLFSMVSFVAIATSAWELTLFQVTPALVDGGIPSLVWSNIWNFIGFTPVILSMAEMSSMAPIAGAQYHWVSEFAPERYQKFLSYLTGWISALAWQAGNATGLFLLGTLVQCIILINDETYAFDNWHATVMAIAIVVLTVLINIYGAHILPYTQNALFAIAIIAYMGFFVPVWVNAPAASSKVVWTDWQNNGGWPSMGLAVLIGQLPAIAAQTGIDTAAHMSEEVRNASSSVPKVMVIIFVVNFAQTFLTVITLAYHLPDVPAALADSTTYPALYVIKESMSIKWMTVLLVVICALLWVGNVSYLAAVSRDLFAFARDQGLPFSNWLAKVDQKKKVPTNAYVFGGVFSSLLSLIYIGSPVAFYAITSLCVVALIGCYVISISCVLWRRIYHPETLPHAQWSLGRWGIPINAAAVIYGTWGFFWSFWPQESPVTAGGFNWSSPIFVLTLIISVIYYFAVGRKKYQGPVALVEGRKGL